MIYLLEFVKGILIAFGIIAGFLITIAYIMSKAEKEDEYEADELLKPFEKYLKKVHEDENYEEIIQVETIVNSLREGKVEDDVSNYKIKKDTSLHLNDEDGKTALRVVTKYIIVKRKTDEPEGEAK